LRPGSGACESQPIAIARLAAVMIKRQAILNLKRFSSHIPFRGPQPIPLGNAKEQKEFMQAVKEEKPATVVEYQFPEFPDNTNPETGEVGGPKGTEPTRFGDWERKGRVSDF
jgi:hypothetical protein